MLSQVAHMGEETQDRFTDNMMYGGHHDSGYGFGVLLMFFVSMFIFLLIIAIVAFYFQRQDKNNTDSDSRETLNKRYAAGEISKKEYNDIKRDISQK